MVYLVGKQGGKNVGYQMKKDVSSIINNAYSHNVCSKCLRSGCRPVDRALNFNARDPEFKSRIRKSR